MKANPGAPVPPEFVFGRNEFIRDLWERLDQQSVVLTAERRIGKTSVIQKMQAEPIQGQLTLYRDLENVRSPLEFAEFILVDVSQYLNRLQKTTRRTQDVLRQLGGADIKVLGTGIKLPEWAAPHWKKIITSTLEDLVENQGDRSGVVLFWDEMPWMLEAIAKNQGQDAATEVLDTLRSLRQSLPSLRMVFMGSIGLHHVLDGFRDGGYGNPATNDMYVFDLPPLDPENATSLAAELLKGENVSLKADLLAVTQAIAHIVDHIPYYIQHLVVRLKGLKKPVDEATVKAVVEQALTDPQDQWQLQHYQTRLQHYYLDTEEYRYALNLLDALAVVDQPRSLGDLVNDLQVALGKNCDREVVRKVLGSLKKDHYIVQSTAGYQFRYGLIQRYWKVARL